MACHWWNKVTWCISFCSAGSLGLILMALTHMSKREQIYRGPLEVCQVPPHSVGWKKISRLDQAQKMQKLIPNLRARCRDSERCGIRTILQSTYCWLFWSLTFPSIWDPDWFSEYLPGNLVWKEIQMRKLACDYTGDTLPSRKPFLFFRQTQDNRYPQRVRNIIK